MNDKTVKDPSSIRIIMEIIIRRDHNFAKKVGLCITYMAQGRSPYMINYHPKNEMNSYHPHPSWPPPWLEVPNPPGWQFAMRPGTEWMLRDLEWYSMSHRDLWAWFPQWRIVQTHCRFWVDTKFGSREIRRWWSSSKEAATPIVSMSNLYCEQLLWLACHWELYRGMEEVKKIDGFRIDFLKEKKGIDSIQAFSYS